MEVEKSVEAEPAPPSDPSSHVLDYAIALRLLQNSGTASQFDALCRVPGRHFPSTKLDNRVPDAPRSSALTAPGCTKVGQSDDRSTFFFERNVRIPWGKPTSYEHVNKYNWKNVVR